MALLRKALSTGFARKGTTHERYLPKYCQRLREQYEGRWWIHSCDLKELAIKREREQRGNVMRRHKGQMRAPWRIVSVLVWKKQRYYGPKKSGNIEKTYARPPTMKIQIQPEAKKWTYQPRKSLHPREIHNRAMEDQPRSRSWLIITEGVTLAAHSERWNQFPA